MKHRVYGNQTRARRTRVGERDGKTASYTKHEKHARASDGSGSQEHGSAPVPTSKVRDMANTEHPCSPEAWRCRQALLANPMRFGSKIAC